MLLQYTFFGKEKVKHDGVSGEVLSLSSNALQQKKKKRQQTIHFAISSIIPIRSVLVVHTTQFDTLNKATEKVGFDQTRFIPTDGVHAGIVACIIQRSS